jgi:23S rRNA (adenine2503-C2)-methyltransferase
MKPNLLDLTLEEFEKAVKPPFHARQAFQWIYEKHVFDFAKMTDLPAKVARKLADQYDIIPAKILKVQSNVDPLRIDGAEKLLIELVDGAKIETVLIYEEDRATACLSTQIGCAMGCIFCASGSGGFERNLASGEIMAQWLLAAQYAEQATAGKKTITNTVLMGMGEPLANYDNTVRFIKAATAPWGLRLSARRITVSTLGLVKMIQRLAQEDLKINLAISLHAPNDSIRSRIVPRNEGINRIIDAAQKYFETTGREITFEYVLLDDTNCEKAHAEELAKRLQGFQCNVNLIPLNPSTNLRADLKPPTYDKVLDFQKTLRRLGVNATLRKSKGAKIQAACGQLRRH